MGCGASSPAQGGNGNKMKETGVTAEGATKKVPVLKSATISSKYLKFRAPEDDPAVPELLAKSIQRFRAAFTYSDVDEIRDAMKNAMRSVAGNTTKQGEIANKSLLELVWAAETVIERVGSDTMRTGKTINWVHITETDTTMMQRADASSAQNPRKGARRLISALRAVLKDGSGRSILDCATFAYENFIFKDDAYARQQMMEFPNVEGLAYAARAVGRRMLEGQFGCPPDPDRLEPEETRVMERYLKTGKRPQPHTWEEVTSLSVLYKSLSKKVAERLSVPDVVQELQAYVAHCDAKEFPKEGEMRVIAALATLCGEKAVTEWGVKALVACLQRPETDAATKAMWKNLKKFMCLDESKTSEGKYFPARLIALCDNPPSNDLCEDARNIATGVSAEDAAPVLRLRNFLWAFLGREHLRSFEENYGEGDEVILAEQRYVAGMVRPQPTSEEELARFEKTFASLADNARARLKGNDVRESAARVMEMRRGASEEVERIVLAALVAIGDKQVFRALPPRLPPKLGLDTHTYEFTEVQRMELWKLCVKKLKSFEDEGGADGGIIASKIFSLGSNPTKKVDPHRLEMARDLLLNVVDPTSESMINGEPFVLALLTATWIAMCQVYLAGFRAEYTDLVIAVEREHIVADLDSQDAAQAVAAKCVAAEEAELAISPFRTVADMAARRFVSNDFRESCRQVLMLEYPPPGILRVLAAVFVLLDEHKVTDHLPPPGMIVAGASNRAGGKPAQPKVSLAAFFRQVDTDGSGALDAGELKRALRAIGLGADEASASMAALDADGDGKVTLREFEAGLSLEVVKKIESRLNAEGTLDSFRPLVDVARVFGQFDADSNGTLSVAELGSVLASLGIEGADLKETMAGFDVDGDGEISLDEWKKNLSDRTKTLMAKRLDAEGLIASYVPPVAGAGPVVESVEAAAGSAGGASKRDPMGPLACLTSGEAGALWDAIRLRINMDESSGDDFFPTKLAAVASGPALKTERCASARALVAGVTARELNASSGLGSGLLHHVRCVLGMNSLKILIAGSAGGEDGNPDGVDPKDAAQVTKDYLSLGVKAQPKTPGEAARLLPVFDHLVVSTAAVFYETDVLRALLEVRTSSKTPKTPTVRVLAALVILANGGAHDVVDMLRTEPALLSGGDSGSGTLDENKDDVDRVWGCVSASIEIEPARPSFLPKDLETAADNATAGIELPSERLALAEALLSGVAPNKIAKEKNVAARCAYQHAWCVIGLHSIRSVMAAAS